MIDALFWYTGLVAWGLIVFGCVWSLVIEPDRSVKRQGTRSPELPILSSRSTADLSG
jgi:hypothetical protein